MTVGAPPADGAIGNCLYRLYQGPGLDWWMDGGQIDGWRTDSLLDAAATVQYNFTLIQVHVFLQASKLVPGLCCLQPDRREDASVAGTQSDPRQRSP